MFVSESTLHFLHITGLQSSQTKSCVVRREVVICVSIGVQFERMDNRCWLPARVFLLCLDGCLCKHSTAQYVSYYLSVPFPPTKGLQRLAKVRVQLRTSKRSCQTGLCSSPLSVGSMQCAIYLLTLLHQTIFRFRWYIFWSRFSSFNKWNENKKT